MSNCSICGEPMPPGEEMFKFHGYSGSCPKPPLPSFVSVMAIALDDAAYLRDLAAYIDPVYKRRLTEIAAKLDHAKADSASEIADLKHQVSEQALKYLSAMGQWDELEADLRQRLEVAEKATIEALIDGRNCTAEWACYASEYFQKKHNLAGVLKNFDDRIADIREAIDARKEPQ